jgi:glyoxylase-like metal-dependent hydrolase (beta-lactamase superfamily II)
MMGLVFDGTGEVREGLHVLGSAAVPVYLLDGPEPVFFDGRDHLSGRGLCGSGQGVLGHRQPSALYLTHVHFDHCGAVQRLRHYG